MKSKKNYVHKNKFLTMFLSFALLTVFLPSYAFAEGNLGVEINAANFPDESFRNYIAGTFDKDHDSILSQEEINEVTSIDVVNNAIEDLTGVEHFAALESLNCMNNNLTSLDVSKNKALTTLNCNFNYLTSLNVSENTALTQLLCGGNGELASLDVSQNTALTQLFCFENKLTSLDVSKNKALTILSCGTNKLTSLDLSQNTALTEVKCDQNSLKKIYVGPNNPQLTDEKIECDEGVVIERTAPKPEPGPQPDPKPEPGPQPDPKPEAGPQPDPKPEAGTQPDQMPEPEAQPNKTPVPNKEVKADNKETKSLPQTGDEENMVLFLGLIGLSVLSINRLRKNK